MKKITDITLCVLEIFVWAISDILDLLSVIIGSLGLIFDSLSEVFHQGSCCLEHFMASLINKKN